MPPRRIATHPAVGWRGCHAHAAEEGMQWQYDAGGELRCHSAAIQLNDLDRFIRFAVLWEKSLAPVVSVVERQLYRENLDLQYITRFGSFYIHRPGQDMPTRPFAIAGQLLNNGLQVRLDVLIRYPRLGQPRGGIGQQGINVNDIA